VKLRLVTRTINVPANNGNAQLVGDFDNLLEVMLIPQGAVYVGSEPPNLATSVSGWGAEIGADIGLAVTFKGGPLYGINSTSSDVKVGVVITTMVYDTEPSSQGSMSRELTDNSITGS
jgi:hypothetical protein